MSRAGRRDLFLEESDHLQELGPRWGEEGGRPPSAGLDAAPGVEVQLREEGHVLLGGDLNRQTIKPEGVIVGDCWSRYYVRVLEMVQSVRIIRQALDRLPSGDVIAPKVKNLKLPDDEVYVEVENPRGQLGFYVRGDGSDLRSGPRARVPPE